MSFAAGFFGTLNDRYKYVQDRTEEQRAYLRSEGIKRQAEVQQSRSQLKEAVSALRSRGMGEDRVSYLLEKSPLELVRLSQQAVTDPNLTGDALNSYIKIQQDYAPSASIEEIIKKVSPVWSEMPEDMPSEVKQSRSISAFLGLDVDAALDDGVYNKEILPGVTGRAVEASLNAPTVKPSEAVQLNPAAIIPKTSADSANFFNAFTENWVAPAITKAMTDPSVSEADKRRLAGLSPAQALQEVMTNNLLPPEATQILLQSLPKYQGYFREQLGDSTVDTMLAVAEDNGVVDPTAAVNDTAEFDDFAEASAALMSGTIKDGTFIKVNDEKFLFANGELTPEVTILPPAGETQTEEVFADNQSTSLTFDEWLKLTEDERKELGLPLNVMDSVGYQFKEEPVVTPEEFNLEVFNNPTEENYKISVRGRPTTYNLTKEQIDKIPEAALKGPTPTIRIEKYEGDEALGRSITSTRLADITTR